MEQASVTAGPGEEQVTPPDRVETPVAEPRRLPKMFAGVALFLTLFALKLKAIFFLVAAKAKLFFVNPFEGFSALQLSMTGGSMIVSVAVYAREMGLGFALGFVVVLVLHEMGHAVMIRVKGLRAGAMVFIPFVGGAVTLKRQPRSAFVDAQIALAGPIAGAIAALVALQIYRWSGDALYFSIAFAGFLINLFNLTPIGPLDGGRIAAAITKWMWVLGGIILFGLTLWRPNPLMILLAVVSIIQVYRAIAEERRRRFYDVSVAQRGRIAAIYFSLLAFLAYETLHCYRVLEALRAGA